jgi:tripartite-type tricarboxylate transporter receptor subunit TctC
MNLTRRQWLGAAASTLLAPGLLKAQPVSDQSTGKIIYGFEAGGTGSTLGESLIAELKRTRQLPLVMDYMTGQGSRRSCEYVKNANPDGTTLLQAPSFSMVLFPHTFRNLPYDSKDFVPLANLCNGTYSFTVGPRVPKDVDTLDKYLQWVSDNPTERNYGVLGNGSSTHLAGLSIARTKDIALRAQSYMGTRSVVQDMLNGTLSAGFTPLGATPTQMASGQLRSLGVCSAKRWNGYEQIPTLAEQGVGDVDIVDWLGWYAPVGTPEDAVKQLRGIVAEAMQTPDFTKHLKAMCAEADTLPATSLVERLKRDEQNYRRLVKLNHLSSTFDAA